MVGEDLVEVTPLREGELSTGAPADIAAEEVNHGVYLTACYLELLLERHSCGGDEVCWSQQGYVVYVEEKDESWCC